MKQRVTSRHRLASEDCARSNVPSPACLFFFFSFVLFTVLSRWTPDRLCVRGDRCVYPDISSEAARSVSGRATGVGCFSHADAALFCGRVENPSPDTSLVFLGFVGQYFVIEASPFYEVPIGTRVCGYVISRGGGAPLESSIDLVGARVTPELSSWIDEDLLCGLILTLENVASLLHRALSVRKDEFEGSFASAL